MLLCHRCPTIKKIRNDYIKHVLLFRETRFNCGCQQHSILLCYNCMYNYCIVIVMTVYSISIFCIVY